MNRASRPDMCLALASWSDVAKDTEIRLKRYLRLKGHCPKEKNLVGRERCVYLYTTSERRAPGYSWLSSLRLVCLVTPFQFKCSPVGKTGYTTGAL